MNLRYIACFFAATLALGVGDAVSATFVISQNNTNALFTPTTRGQANSSWFGWGYGQLAGDYHPVEDYRLVDNAPTTKGSSDLSLRGTIWQVQKQYNIVSSTLNIYPLTYREDRPFSYPIGETYAVTVTIDVPINVSLENVGRGFTTIIVQGNSVSSAYTGAANPPEFLTLTGTGGNVQMSYVVGTNISTINATSAQNGIGKGQFWVKYEIEGSAENYEISFKAGLSGNVAGLTVDTYWSEDGYSDDIAIAAVPEPSTTLLALSGLAAIVWICRKRRKQAA